MAIRSDDFNRTDSTTSLGTSSSGHVWSVAGGSHGIISNTAYTNATANNQSVIDLGEADVDAVVTLSSVSASGRGGVIFRGTSGTSTNDNWRFCKWTTATTVNLIKTVGGVVTNDLKSVPTLTAGDVLRVLAVGDSIRTYLNGVLVHNITDSALNTGTWHGIQVIEASGVRLDNWSAVSAEAGLPSALSVPVVSSKPVPGVGANARPCIR